MLASLFGFLLEERSDPPRGCFILSRYLERDQTGDLN